MTTEHAFDTPNHAASVAEAARIGLAGQAAYEAYSAHTGGVSLVTRTQLLPWARLQEEIQDAWCAAATAAASVRAVHVQGPARPVSLAMVAAGHAQAAEHLADQAGQHTFGSDPEVGSALAAESQARGTLAIAGYLADILTLLAAAVDDQ